MTPAMRRPTIEGLPSPASSAPNAPKPNQAPAFNLNLRRSLQMHPFVAVITAACVLLVVVGLALTRKPMYEAESLVYVDPINSKVLSSDAGGYDPTRYDSYLQQQMQTAVRPDILSAALAKLPTGVWRHAGESEQSAIDRLGNDLKVKRVGSSYQLSIALDADNPKNVAAVVNAVTAAYLEQGRKDEHTLADQRLQLLNDERGRVQAELDSAKAEAAVLGAQLGVANPVGDAGNAYDLQLEGLRNQLAEARQQHDVAEAQLASVTGASGAGSPGLVASADDLIANDASLNSLRTSISSRKATLSSQMAGLTPNNPVYKQDQDEIAELDKSEDRMAADLRSKAERRLQDKLRLDLARTGDIEARLNGQLAHQTAAATGATPKLQRSAELAADIQRLTLRYATVDDAIRSIKLETSGPGLAHLSVAASVPASPEPSRRSLMLLFAVPLALMAGAGAAVLMQKRDAHIYTGADVEQVLGFLPIGVVPAREEVSEAVLEEYGMRLAAGLASAYRISAAQSFVLTAASPSIEIGPFLVLLRGKLEELGFRAQVVEASELLLPLDVDRDAAEHDSGILVPGSVSHEGYASAHLERLRAQSDVLLIDAPPLLHSAEAEYLVRCADATIVIAECGVTLRGELYQAAVLLQRLNVAGVGAVLQELHLRFADPSFRRSIELLEDRQVTHPRGPANVASVAAERERVVEQREAFVEPVVVPVAPLVIEPVQQEVAAAVAPVIQEGLPEPHVAAQAVAVEEPAEKEELPVPSDVVPFDQKRAAPEESMFDEPKRSWFERIFSRQNEPVVSIVPDSEGNEEDVASASPELAPRVPVVAAEVAAPVYQGRQTLYDIPVREPEPELVMGAALPPMDAPVWTPEPVVAAAPVVIAPPAQTSEVEFAPNVEVVQAVDVPVMPPFAAQRLPVRPMSFKQLTQSKPQPAVVAPAVAESAPVASGVVMPRPEVVEAFVPAVKPEAVVKAPAAAVMATAPVALVAEQPVAVEAPAPKAPMVEESRPAPVAPVRVAVVEPAPSEPVTTGRWEPALVPRLVSPDSGARRLESGSLRPAPPRAITQPAARPTPSPAAEQTPRPAAARPLAARPEPVNVPAPHSGSQPDPQPGRNGMLSRRWELLSRFDKPQPDAEQEQDVQEPAAAVGGSSRQYRSVR